jgi:DNA polymerase-3 subunit gamma/tau
MSYTVTATRMRPAIFDQLAGQDFVATSLKKSVASGKIAHAYLFSGPRGVGKTSAARILAKAINCQNPSPDGNPCCQCSSCREIAQGNSMDVIEIDGASNTSVNDVRQIKDEVLFAPANSKYKVYIIDEVHMLSNSAFNALLKTIEEPPPYIVFIFATTEVYKVPATIRSRCQHFNFRLIHTDVIKDRLRKICEDSKIKADDDVLFWIAKEATGSLRDSYTLFDKIAAFSGSEISLALIKEKMGLVGFDKINQLAECFADGESTKALEILDDILASGVAVEQFVTELTEYLRNILLIKSNVTKEAVLGYSSAAFSPKVIAEFSTYQIEQALAMVLQLYRDLRYSLSQRFELELLVTRLSSMKNFVSSAELVERLEALKKGFVAAPRQIQKQVQSTIEQPAEIQLKPEESQPADNQPPLEQVAESDNRIEQPAPELDIKAVRNNVIVAFKKKKEPFLSSALQRTGEWILKEGKVTIPCSDSFQSVKVEESVQKIESVIAELTGQNIAVEVFRPENEEKSEPAEGNPAVSPSVEMVKKVFKGEIV